VHFIAVFLEQVELTLFDCIIELGQHTKTAIMLRDTIMTMQTGFLCIENNR